MSLDSSNSEEEKIAPRVFIGSSSRALPITHAIAKILEDNHTIEVDVWNQGILQLGDVLLDALLRRAALSDFALFVITADDVTLSNGKQLDSPRDNVIFELGMFMGTIGRRRAFPVIIYGPNGLPKLPSDLEGLLTCRVQLQNIDNLSILSNENMKILHQEITKIRAVLEERWKETPLSLLPSVGLAFGYFHNFILPVNRLIDDRKVFYGSTKERFDFKKRNYDFTINIPRLASKATVQMRDRYAKERNWESIVAEKEQQIDVQSNRSYSFFAYPERKDDDPIHFCDYPTTMRASSDAISLILPQQALGERADERGLLDRREARTFFRALEHLLASTDGSHLEGVIKLKWVD
ncbi:TIR domain-containing protein [Methylocystis sp. 9N]|uniref:CD-NTase-associated protein 12 n=1 Tax=Methylocystis borbori TaxID=3118750 RepID=A0ABU7XDV3_9HYPH